MIEQLVAAGASANPLYLEVKRRLTGRLASGEWRPGQPLPSETRLATEFGVSIGTVRKAVDDLVADNILVRQQGRGTYVTAHSQDRTLFYFFHIVGDDGRKQYPVTELVSFNRGRAGSAAQLLGLKSADGVYRIRNLLYLSGSPVLVDDIVVPQSLFPNLNRAGFESRDTTIYGLYQAAFGVNVIRTRERLRARSATADVAALLQVESAAPVLEIHRVAYTYDDQPVECRVSRVNTAGHDYYNDIA